MRIISAIWSSWLHSQLWEPLWQGLFSSVRYYGHSGSQEIGHLKLVVLQENGFLRSFCEQTGHTEDFSSKSHSPSIQWGSPLCAPQKAICPPYSGFFPCVLLTSHFPPVFPHQNSSLYWWYMAFWGAHRGKILCMPRLLAKTPQKATLPQKPPIWGALIPPGLNAKAKKTWAPDTWLRTFSQALNLLTHPNFDTLKQHNWKGPAAVALMLAHLFEQSTYAEDRTE